MAILEPNLKSRVMDSLSQPSAKRINSVDILRGAVMVIMVLDHVRDFFSGFRYEPTDLAHASAFMFFTRWITHYCAPVFVFLSGTSAFLSMGRGRTVQQEAWRLLTRGLWLVVLEVTVIRLGWAFDMDYRLVFLQVIWAIGVSMIVLSGLIFLPMPVILVFALVMIFGHDALDGYNPGGWLWQLLHVQGPIKYGNDNTLFVFYPLIPWVGVMAAGYCFGSIFRKPDAARVRWQFAIGLPAVALFMILRGIDHYGDPALWQSQENLGRTVLSFLNVSKYPPSLLYLLMTLGPAIALMPLLERAKGWLAGFFTVYGRVPLFFYVLHLFLVHGMAVVGSKLFSGGAVVSAFAHPGYRLWVVYAIWISAVLILYLPCRWFMGVKKRYRYWWLSYL